MTEEPQRMSPSRTTPEPLGRMKRHTRSCILALFHQRNAREDYEERYPCYCEECEGWGYIHYLPDIDLDLLLDAPKEVFNRQYCRCVLTGKCPRCGTDDAFDLESGDCEECGFVLGKTEGMPLRHQCSCSE